MIRAKEFRLLEYEMHTNWASLEPHIESATLWLTWRFVCIVSEVNIPDEENVDEITRLTTRDMLSLFEMEC